MKKVADYLRIKEQMDELQAEAHRAEGTLRQLKDQLKMQFGSDSLKEAERMLKQIGEEITKAEQEYKKASERWFAQYQSREGLSA